MNKKAYLISRDDIATDIGGTMVISGNSNTIGVTIVKGVRIGSMTVTGERHVFTSDMGESFDTIIGANSFYEAIGRITFWLRDLIGDGQLFVEDGKFRLIK